MSKRGKVQQAAKRAVQEPPAQPPPPWMKISDWALMNAGRRPERASVPNPFQAPAFPPSSMRRVPRAERLAMDDAVLQVNGWAAQQMYNGAWFEGTTFLGYTYLSELAQRPEYRRMVEVVATEATRKWIELQSQEGEDKTERIQQLQEALEALDAQGAFRRVIEIDGFMGRSHLYLDTGDTDDRHELMVPIGDGAGAASSAKVSPKHPLLALRPVEPVWCYPARYNATDPLKPDWYHPQSWFVQGKEIHSTRLLRFVAREVPDLLKPAYAFGGLSLTQLAKPYVDNWLRGRQAISDLVWAFSTSVFSTDLTTLLQADGAELFKRIELFNRLKNNRSVMLLNKESEEYQQQNTPLGTLDALQAQLQEHMCSVTGIPVVKLLGIQPAGLNASSEGELESWYDWIEAFQEKIIRERLQRVVNFTMLSLWGEVDHGITFRFVPLRADDPVQAAQVRKLDAETGSILIEDGAVSQAEERQRVARDPDSGYDGIDEDELPVAPGGGENPDEAAVEMLPKEGEVLSEEDNAVP